MGRRGPAPTPTEVLRARGETRPSLVGKATPSPRRVAPSLPRGLNKRAAAVWRRVLKEMPVGVIRAADTDIFRAYCESVALYEQAVELLFNSSPVISGARNKELVRNPLHQIVRDHREAIRLLAREIGATPAARVGLQIDGGFGPSDPRGWESDMDRELGPTPRALRVVGGQDE